MNVLIYGHRKTEPVMYDISTPEKELAAYLIVFQTLEDFGVYADLDEVQILEKCQPCEKGLHDYCVAGVNSRTGGECGCTETKNCKDRADRASRNIRQLMVWEKWRQEALEGNGESAKKLLKDRSHRQYEYETLEFGSVIDPLEKKNARTQTA
jgi:hypothetical protein